MNKKAVLPLPDFVSGQIFDLAVTADHSIWLAHEHGLAFTGPDGEWKDGYLGLFGDEPVPATCLLVTGGERMLAGVPGGILRQGGPLGWEAVMLGLPPPLVLQITGGLNADGQEFLWAATEEDGILRSLDGGQSWQAWNFGLLDANMFGLAVSPHFRTDRQIWAATSTGLFRSWNGGVGWECCPIMNVEKYTRVEQIACGVSGGQVWLVAGSANMGLWRTHGGSEWWEQCKGYPLGLEPAKLRSVPGLEGWLLCLGGNQLWGSQDEGRNFIPLGPEYPVVMSYACLNGEVWLACEDGIHRLPL